MSTAPKTLGILKPLGGGDPIVLQKAEMTVGRRPNSDIRLEYSNVSGRHCILRWEQEVWNVYDLGSANGTTVNGGRINGSRGVMPDDCIGFADHMFSIQYELVGEVGLTKSLLENQFSEKAHRNNSSSVLAGLPAGNAASGFQPSPGPRGRGVGLDLAAVGVDASNGEGRSQGGPAAGPRPIPKANAKAKVQEGGHRRATRVDPSRQSIERMERLFRGWQDLSNLKKVAAIAVVIAFFGLASTLQLSSPFRVSATSLSRRVVDAAVHGKEDELRRFCVSNSVDDAIQWFRMVGPGLKRQLGDGTKSAVRSVWESEGEALIQFEVDPVALSNPGQNPDAQAQRIVRLVWVKGPRGDWLLDGARTLQTAIELNLPPAAAGQP